MVHFTVRISHTNPLCNEMHPNRRKHCLLYDRKMVFFATLTTFHTLQYWGKSERISLGTMYVIPVISLKSDQHINQGSLLQWKFHRNLTLIQTLKKMIEGVTFILNISNNTHVNLVLTSTVENTGANREKGVIYALLFWWFLDFIITHFRLFYLSYLYSTIIAFFSNNTKEFYFKQKCFW